MADLVWHGMTRFTTVYVGDDTVWHAADFYAKEKNST